MKSFVTLKISHVGAVIGIGIAVWWQSTKAPYFLTVISSHFVIILPAPHTVFSTHTYRRGNCTFRVMSSLILHLPCEDRHKGLIQLIFLVHLSLIFLSNGPSWFLVSDVLKK